MRISGPIHPKAGGAGLFAAGGTLLVAVLKAAHVEVPADLAGAIGAFTAALGAWIVPAGNPSTVTLGLPETVAQELPGPPAQTVIPVLPTTPAPAPMPEADSTP